MLLILKLGAQGQTGTGHDHGIEAWWCYTYFLDEKRSVQLLKEQQGTMVFDEADPQDVQRQI